MSETINITIRGRKFTVDAAHESFWRMCERGEWEPYTFETFDKYLTREHTFVDVGAWIGVTALYAAPLVKYTFAFEPDPTAFDVLVRNCHANYGDISTTCTAILDSYGTVEFGCEELGNSMTRVSCRDHAFVARCRTLPMATLGLTRMFIKLDIEGSEELVTRDLSFFEQRKPTLYISLHPQFWQHVDAVWRQFTRLGLMYRHQQEVAENVWLLTDEEPKDA